MNTGTRFVIQFKTVMILLKKVVEILEEYGKNDNTKDVLGDELSLYISYFRQTLFKDSIKRRFRLYRAGDISRNSFVRYLQKTIDKPKVYVSKAQKERYLYLVEQCFGIKLEDKYG